MRISYNGEPVNRIDLEFEIKLTPVETNRTFRLVINNFYVINIPFSIRVKIWSRSGTLIKDKTPDGYTFMCECILLCTKKENIHKFDIALLN